MGVETEAALLRAAAEHGVPVARVVASDDGGVLGSAGMVVERLAGETIARKLLRDEEWSVARERLGEQVGAATAAIHAIPVEAVKGLQPADQVAQYRTVLDGLSEPHPAFELGFRWLEANRPPETRRAWSTATCGWATCSSTGRGCGRCSTGSSPTSGTRSRTSGGSAFGRGASGRRCPPAAWRRGRRWWAAYERASGRHVDPLVLRWWEVLGTLKWGVICMMQAWAHLSGASRSMELATIGRRVCENEWDLLGLLPGDALPRRDPPPPEPGAALHDRPTLAELVEAVREWVDDDVRSGTEGRLSFHARVAANALRTVERELALEPELTRAHGERLAPARLRRRSGARRPHPHRRAGRRADEVRTLVAESVHDKLLVANPGWLAEG